LRALLVLILLLSPLGEVVAQGAGGARVRVTVDPAEGVVIGQRIHLFVDVLFPDDMPHPPKVATPEIPGAQVFRFESQATNLSDRIDGRSYVGQRFEFAIYPRRGGSLAVPPVAVALMTRAGNPTGEVRSDPVNVTVTVPPGIDQSQPVVASTEVSATEQWAPDPTGAVTVGDAVKRVVVRTATDVPGLALAALDASAREGVRVYADPPDISDSTDRGDVIGRRTDRVTYVFEKPGTYRLPDIAQTWWDLDDGKVKLSSQPGRDVVVRAGPAAVAAAGPQPAGPVRPWLWAAGVMLALLGAVMFGLLSGPVFVRYWHRWRKSRTASELFAFRILRRISRSGDAASTYQALAVWRARLPPPPSTVHTNRLPDRSDAARLVDLLEQTLFSDTPTAWSREQGRQMADTLPAMRRSLLSTRVNAVSSTEALPPLNPGEPCSLSSRLRLGDGF
jgi:hypothetical protein